MAASVIAVVRAATGQDWWKPRSSMPGVVGQCESARRQSQESAEGPRLARRWKRVQGAHARRVRQHWASECVPCMP